MDEFEKSLLHMKDLQLQYNDIPEWAKAEKLEYVISQKKIWNTMHKNTKKNSLTEIREKRKSRY